MQRVTHDEQTRTKTVPHGTQTIIDASLQPGEAVVRQEGEDGEIQQTYDVTYVDGVEESEKLINEVTTKIATATDTDDNEPFGWLSTLPSIGRPSTDLCGRRGSPVRLDRTALDQSGQTMES